MRSQSELASGGDASAAAAGPREQLPELDSESYESELDPDADASAAAAGATPTGAKPIPQSATLILLGANKCSPHTSGTTQARRPPMTPPRTGTQVPLPEIFRICPNVASG